MEDHVLVVYNAQAPPHTFVNESFVKAKTLWYLIPEIGSESRELIKCSSDNAILSFRKERLASVENVSDATAKVSRTSQPEIKFSVQILNSHKRVLFRQGCFFIKPVFLNELIMGADLYKKENRALGDRLYKTVSA